MNKADIITRLSQSKKLKQIARNIAGSYGLGDDLYQHLFLVLCEYDEAKLVDAEKCKASEFLCIKIMSNSFHSKSSPFAKQHRQFMDDVEFTGYMGILDPHEEMEEALLMREWDELILPVERYLRQPITQDNFYKITLLKRWASGESYQDIANITDIPKRSIGMAIKGAIDEIRELVL